MSSADASFWCEHGGQLSSCPSRKFQEDYTTEYFQTWEVPSKIPAHFQLVFGELCAEFTN